MQPQEAIFTSASNCAQHTRDFPVPVEQTLNPFLGPTGQHHPNPANLGLTQCHGSSSVLIWLLPQGLYMSCPLCLEHTFVEIHIACSFLLLTSQFQCHFLGALLTTLLQYLNGSYPVYFFSSLSEFTFYKCVLFSTH